MRRAVIAASLLALAGAVAAAQTARPWREDGLASFDEVWQTIADTFYDPSFAGVDWAATRRELRPKAAAAGSANEIRGIIREMIGRLHRSHFALLSASDAPETGSVGSATVLADVRVSDAGLVVVGVRPGSAAERAGLAPGQIVLAVDEIDTAGWRPGGADPAGRRRTFDLWRKAWRALHGAPGSVATVKIRTPGGAERVLPVSRERDDGEVVTLGNLPPLPVRVDVRELRSPHGRRVGLIAFNVWMTAIDSRVAEAFDRFEDADGVILDLRGNPGGLAAMISGLAGHVIADPQVRLGTMQTRQGQLEFRVNPRLVLPDGRATRPFAGPLAILVDELTASASECFTGALQDLGRARVFGRRTLGEALPALTRRLADGDVLMYAVGSFVTGSGRPLEGDGVAPDESVPLSPRSLAAGRDDTVIAALRWFDTTPLALRGRLLLSSNDLQAR